MTVKLFLTPKSRPWETIYHTENGQPLYRAFRADLSTSTGTDTLTIFKIGTSGQDHREIASIRLRAFHSDELTINGITMKDKNFFTKKSGSILYGSDRVWTGPDGQEYRWVMRSSKPELYRNDSSETLVAKFHREHSGWGFRDKAQASLDIFPTPPFGLSEGLLDMIVVTFVYMETKRADMEKAATKGASESAGAVVG
ncbi:hypothetical protein BKA70DRAFT_1307764 [Coprinopsis sp. MPI-PUGE-AT-0042]|nr:hypothetical protein BKA70DRAFT_1307764 [Coprinopsis sp. MPI-PUGE-AT-0042]